MSSKALFSQENPGAFRYLIWVEKVPHSFLSPARYQLGYLAGGIWGIMNLPICYPYRVNFCFNEKIPTFLCPLTYLLLNL